MSSLVTAFAASKLPQGCSPSCRNMRYGNDRTVTRYGISLAFSTGRASRVTSLGSLIRIGSATPYIPLAFHADGTLFQESPVGGGVASPINPTAAYSAAGLPVNAYMESATAFTRTYMAFGDGKNALGDPAVFDGINLDPWSMRPLGEAWAANTNYIVGEIVAPQTRNGFIYRCTVAGQSGANQPAFPTTDRATVADGGVTWQEANIYANSVLPAPASPALTINAGAGAIAAGQDLYIRITFLNANGESLYSSASTKINTAANTQALVASPVVPSWLSTLVGAKAITSFKIYAALVATGAAAPAVASYASQGAVGIGVGGTINSIGAGAAPPTTATATISNAGNVDTGSRYGTIFFVNRNGYISGATSAAVFNSTLAGANFSLFVGGIPLGPANTVQRIIALTPANQSDFGPFLYVPKADNKTGVAIDTFIINDNTSTAATINFNDNYLQTATDATDNLRKVRLPRQAHCAFMATLHRFFTFGEAGQPSLVRVSQPDDAETFYGDTGYFYVARDNGERAITAREWRGTIYLWKERSCYTVQPSDTDPATWAILPLFNKIGIPGPRATDSGAQFMAFANRSGGYLYDGSSPILLTGEIQDQWDTINWNYEHLISVHVDDEEMEIRFTVPTGNSTYPNTTFTMNYLRGWDSPIHFSSYTGKEVSHPAGRKWSIDDIAAFHVMRMERPLVVANPNDPLRADFALAQILLASPTEDGTVSMITPDSYADNGGGIDSWYEIANVALPDGSISRCGAAIVQSGGQGDIELLLKPQEKDPIPLRAITADGAEPQSHRRQCRGSSRSWGLRVSNGKVAGAWFELLSVTMYLSSIWPSEIT